MTIDNKELAINLSTLAIMCASERTDECDITIKTNIGRINCHIEFDFSEVIDNDTDSCKQ